MQGNVTLEGLFPQSQTLQHLYIDVLTWCLGNNAGDSSSELLFMVGHGGAGA